MKDRGCDYFGTSSLFSSGNLIFVFIFMFYMERFAAIDFETANGKRSSVCSVGIVIIEDNHCDRPGVQPDPPVS